VRCGKIERAARPAGELFEQQDEPQPPSPLRPMTSVERVVADYAGTGMTIGPHPMALRRGELSLRGVLRAIDLPEHGAGAGCVSRAPSSRVSARERPRASSSSPSRTKPHLERHRPARPLRSVSHGHRGRAVPADRGVLQQQDGVVSIRADRLQSIGGAQAVPASHDFH